MGNNAIANVKTPANSTDAVNKEYVDNAVAGVKPSGDYLPLSGGTMSGPIQFDTTATVASIPDMGFGIQVPNGYTGIVSQGIMHTDKAVSLDSNAVTYDIVNTQIAPGTTIKKKLCLHWFGFSANEFQWVFKCQNEFTTITCRRSNTKDASGYKTVCR